MGRKIMCGAFMDRKEAHSKWFTPGRLWKWACQHPGTVMVGAMLLAALLVPRPHGKNRPPVDLDPDETPLFI